MKSFFTILFTSLFAVNTLAAAVPPGTTLPIRIIDSTGPQVLFGIGGNYQPTDFEKGGIYYFQIGNDTYQSTNRGVENNATKWSSMEKVPESRKPGDSAASGISSDTEEGNSHGTSDSGAGSGGGFFNSTLGSAIQGGIAHGILKGVIFTPDFMAEMGRLQQETEANNQATTKNYEDIATAAQQNQEKYAATVKEFREALADMKTAARTQQPITYTSTDTQLVTELKELEQILNSVRSSNPVRQASRSWGLAMIWQSDQASAQQDTDSAIAFRQYAESFADLAIGLDPITGPIRDVYEAFTGKNLVTGEELTNMERAFALFGALSFGFGSKIAKGIKVITGLGKTPHYARAVQDVEKLTIHARGTLRSQTSAEYYRYIQELRQVMERPTIKNPELKAFIEDRFWKSGGTIGNGSTTAAIRYEKRTGLAVKDRYHSLKGEHSRKYLKRWLESNPNAAATDRRAVEHIIEDLDDAMRGN